MTIPELNIAEELPTVHSKGWSLDKYVEFRRIARKEQVFEIFEAGNISVLSYGCCISHNATHEEILQLAALALEPPDVSFELFVRDYVGYGVSFDNALAARKNGIPCTLGASTSLSRTFILHDVLEHTTIGELIGAWRQLLPGMDRHSFLRTIAAGKSPEAALRRLL